MDLSKPPIFKEEQTFRQVWWIWALLGSVFTIMAITFYASGMDLPPSAYIGISIAPVFTILVLYAMKLTTIIDENGISYQFFFYHWKPRKMTWMEITESYVRTYRPIMEYGGWGLRWSFRGQGQAVNVRGNRGIQLVLLNGKKLLIGTQKPEEAEAALRKINKWTEPDIL